MSTWTLDKYSFTSRLSKINNYTVRFFSLKGNIAIPGSIGDNNRIGQHTLFCMTSLFCTCLADDWHGNYTSSFPMKSLSYSNYLSII